MRSLIGEESSRPRLLFNLPLDAARLLRARHRIRDYLHQHQAEPAAIDDIVLAVEEAMTNAVRHSGTTDDIRVCLLADGTDLLVTVKDRGRGFDVTAFDRDELPDLDRSTGRGLYLIAHLMNELRLSNDQGLEVRAVKHDVFPAEHGGPSKGPPGLWALPDAAMHRDERLRSMLEEIEEGFFALDWEYRFTLVNKTFEEMFRLPREHLLGRAIWDLFPALTDDGSETAIRDAMEIGLSSIHEYRPPTLGSWLELRVYPTSSGVSGYTRDIEDRKRVELERERLVELLRERTAEATLLADVVEHGEMPFGIGSPEGGLMMFNAAYAALTGYSREELEGMGLRWSTDLTPPEWRRKEARILRKAVERRSAVHYEKEYLRKDGARVPIDCFVQPVFDERGDLLHYRAFFADISARKQEEALRRVSEEQFSLLFQSMHEGVALHELVYDADGVPVDYRVVAVNDAYERHTGLRREDVEGRLASQAYGSGEAPYLREFSLAAEHTRFLSFGTYFPGMNRYFEIDVVSPARGRFATIFTDVTERRRSELELRESEQRYRELVNNANSAIIRWSRDGTIRFINEHAERLFGWSKAEAVGRKVDMFVPKRETTGADLTRLARDIVAHPERFTNNVNENVCRDGRRVWMNWTNRAIYDQGGQVSEILAVGNDVTERRQAEEELRRSREDLDRAQAVGQVGSWRLDADQGTLTWSRETYRIFGLPEGTPITTKTYAARVHPGDRALVDSAWQAALRGEPYDVEHRVVADGAERWVRDKGVLEHDEDGRLLGAFGISQDITARRHAEASLARREQVLRGINTILEAALASADEEELGRVCLNVAADVTESEFGFINELGEDGELHDIAISDPGWSACEAYEARGHGQQLQGFPLRGLYAPVLLEGRTLLTNAPASHPASRGVPPGHPRLTAFLAAPLKEHERAAGLVAVANRPGGYGVEQRQALEALTPAMLEAFRRKRAEQRLRESETRLRLAGRAAHVGFYEWNITRDTVYWSPEMYLLFDVDHGTRIDAGTWLAHVHPDDREQLARATQLAAEEGESRTSLRLEYRVTRRDGNSRWLESTQGVETAGGDVVMRGIVADVTERRQTEEALRESEERLRASELHLRIALEAAFLISFEWDIKRNQVRRFASAEPSLGVTPDGETSTLEAVLEVVHPDDRRLFRSSIDAALRSDDGLYECEFRIVREDGEVIWLSERGRVERDAEGSPSRLIGLSQDVTERKASQERLQTLYESQRRIATTLQESFLHDLPDLPDLEVGLVEAPASEPGLIGGDFWDLYELPGRRAIAIIGDVAGKGIPAAGMTETVRSTMRAFAHVRPDPGFILGETNQLVGERSASDLLVTALVLVIDLESGEVSMASAGHPGPVRLHAGDASVIDPVYGLPLGGLPEVYETSCWTFEPGDSLVLYTDGVTEARRAGVLFGQDGLVRCLSGLDGAPARLIAETVRRSAEDFCGTLRDDLEVLVLRRR